MKIEKIQSGYKLTYPRPNGASILYGKNRMNLIGGMLETLEEEREGLAEYKRIQAQEAEEMREELTRENYYYEAKYQMI